MDTTDVRTENILLIAPQATYARVVARATKETERGGWTEESGQEREGGQWKARRGRRGGRAGIRGKHQEWRTTEAIVFRGNLQNVSFHRGPYQPNWFVIPFHRRPGARVGDRKGRGTRVGGCWYCVYSREKVHLPCPDGRELSDSSFRPNGIRSRTRPRLAYS